MKLIIIEDDLISSQVLSLLLEREGHQVLAQFASADDLQNICEKLSPEIILLDIMLAGTTDGVTAAEALRASKIQTPILFVSALTVKEVQDRIDQVPHAGFTSKPYQIQQIVEMMSQLAG